MKERVVVIQARYVTLYDFIGALPAAAAAEFYIGGFAQTAYEIVSGLDPR